MLRTIGGDAIGRVTRLPRNRRGSAEGGAIAIPSPAATTSNMEPNCSTTIMWFRLTAFAAASPSISRRSPEAGGNDTSCSRAKSCRVSSGLAVRRCAMGNSATQDSRTTVSATMSSGSPTALPMPKSAMPLRTSSCTSAPNPSRRCTSTLGCARR